MLILTCSSCNSENNKKETGGTEDRLSIESFSDDATTKNTEREPDEQDDQASGGIKATEYNSLTTSFAGFSGVLMQN